jgi:hypothetical protein
MEFEAAADDKDEIGQTPDTSMIQMAKMHGTFHVHDKVNVYN